MLFPVTFFWSLFADADPITGRGLAIYDRASTRAGLSSFHDFVPRLSNPKMSAAQQALMEKRVVDVIRLFGHLDGSLTTIAQQILVRKMWQASGPDFDPLAFTLGEMYMLRQVQRLDLATQAARALGKDPSRGFLHLTQVTDLNPRTYDGVVIARRAGDTPDLNRTDIDPDIVMRLESKWLLDPKTRIDDERVAAEMAMDLIQSIERNQSFHDIYWSVPESRGEAFIEATKDWFLEVFESVTVPDLKTYYRQTNTQIDAYRDALEERLALGNLVFTSPDSAD
ncbi:MAG: hypothetical protein ACRCYQ_02645 [Nocardioides sp.]